MSIQIKYSIVISMNEWKTLPQCLDSILRQTISKKEYEILLVDGASEEYIFKDELNKIFFAQNIKYLFKKGANSAELKNLGVKAAKGEIIFFTESSCAVPENWLEEFIKRYRRHPDIVGVSGWIKAAGGKRKYVQKYLDAQHEKYGIIALREEKVVNFLDSLIGRTFNISYKKAVLTKIGGFDSNFFTPEMADIDAQKRVATSGSLMYLPLAVEDRGNKNLFGLIKIYFGRGQDFYYWSRKYPRNNFFYFKTLPNFIIYTGVNLIEDKTFLFFKILTGAATFLGVKFANFFKKSVLVMLFDLEKKPPKNFEIIKKINSRKITTHFACFSKNKNYLINNNKFYSVIIPTYNRSRSLINALNHLINQTIPKNNYEIIVVDDGSTDDTETQISKYKIQNTKYNIRYFKTENGGPAKARNFGIKRAKGEIIFFTDDDCVVPPDWMATLLSGLKKYPEAAGAGGWYLPSESETERSVDFWQKHCAHYFVYRVLNDSLRQYEILSNDPFRCLVGVFAYNTANVCYKKAVIEKVGGFKEDFYWPGAEDNELAFRITLLGYLLLYIPFYVIDYNIRDFKGFIKLHFHRGANNYFLRTIHRRILEELRLGFFSEYGSLSSFLTRFSGPEKIMAFLEWISLNAGIMYMKNKLTLSGAEVLIKRDNPILPEPNGKIGDN